MNGTDPIVTLQDVRAAHNCADGLRAYCRRNGLDLRAFVRHGIRASRLPSDALSARVIAAARRRIEGGS